MKGGGCALNGGFMNYDMYIKNKYPKVSSEE